MILCPQGKQLGFLCGATSSIRQLLYFRTFPPSISYCTAIGHQVWPGFGYSQRLYRKGMPDEANYLGPVLDPQRGLEELVPAVP